MKVSATLERLSLRSPPRSNAFSCILPFPFAEPFRTAPFVDAGPCFSCSVDSRLPIPRRVLPQGEVEVTSRWRS